MYTDTHMHIYIYIYIHITIASIAIFIIPNDSKICIHILESFCMMNIAISRYIQTYTKYLSSYYVSPFKSSAVEASRRTDQLPEAGGGMVWVYELGCGTRTALP